MAFPRGAILLFDMDTREIVGGFDREMSIIAIRKGPMYEYYCGCCGEMIYTSTQFPMTEDAIERVDNLHDCGGPGELWRE